MTVIVAFGKDDPLDSIAFCNWNRFNEWVINNAKLHPKWKGLIVEGTINLSDALSICADLGYSAVEEIDIWGG